MTDPATDLAPALSLGPGLRYCLRHPVSQPLDVTIHPGGSPLEAQESSEFSLLHHFPPRCTSSRVTPSLSPLHRSPPRPGPNRPPLILVQIHIVLARKHQRGRVVTYSISEMRRAAPCFINTANVDSCHEKCTNAGNF